MKKPKRQHKSLLVVPRRDGQVEFWTDEHHRRMAIVVECDDPRYPVIAVFRYTTSFDKVKAEVRANRVLKGVQAGRVDYRLKALRVPKEFQWDRTYVGNRG